VHPKYNETVDKIIAWSKQDRNIRGSLILGSQVREELEGDEWSDLDVLLLADKPPLLMNTDNWLESFGEVVCVTFEETGLDFINLNWCIKRALFDDHRVIDFSILPYDRLDDVLSINKDIHALGYKVIYDANSNLLNSKIEKTIKTVKNGEPKIPTEEELGKVINELLFHIIWSFKKIKRQELWVAVSCINGHISDLLLRLIEFHNGLITKRSNIVMYEGRFLEVRTSREIIDKLRHCFSKYDESEAINTLGQLIDVTYFISKEISEENGYKLSAHQFEMIRKIYGEMKAEA
jgi:aminoglycoside 6-adenylyltransferase